MCTFKKNAFFYSSSTLLDNQKLQLYFDFSYEFVSVLLNDDLPDLNTFSKAFSYSKLTLLCYVS